MSQAPGKVNKKKLTQRPGNNEMAEVLVYFRVVILILVCFYFRSFQ